MLPFSKQGLAYVAWVNLFASVSSLVHLQVTPLQEAGVTRVTWEMFTDMNTIVLWVAESIYYKPIYLKGDSYIRIIGI